MPQSTYNAALSGNPQSATSAQYPNGNPDASLNPAGVKNTDSCVPLHRTDEVVHNYHCDGPAPGNLVMRWLYGSNIAAKNRDPRIQAIQYNEDTYILRQNVCVHWEAPFTYLLFGNKGALLIDTGATAEAAYYPLRATVDAIIARWAQMRRKQNVPLTVALTSREDIAQNQGLAQFIGRPGTTLASARIDLGDRIIDVIPAPGAHKDGIVFYDPYNDFLYTGDLLFPGKINISNDRDYLATLQRLKQWKDTHPVKWIMGGHIEMQFVPGKVYPRFATYKPYERVLQMEPDLIDDALASSQQVLGKEIALVRPDFILLNRVSPDQKTPVFPEGVPNINAPRPF
jgi:glyoxylase-like metal-dependent hydrolase (beta-lactamase superfamily II)